MFIRHGRQKKNTYVLVDKKCGQKKNEKRIFFFLKLLTGVAPYPDEKALSAESRLCFLLGVTLISNVFFCG